jgi:hypothetical protein
VKKVYRCQAVSCEVKGGRVIPEERVWGAISRKLEPRFCSHQCANRQTSKENYEKKRGSAVGTNGRKKTTDKKAGR